MLDKFFRSLLKKEDLPEGWKTSQYLGVPYDPALALVLTHQHRALNMLLVEASSAAQLGDYTEVGHILEQFEAGLAEHLRHERAHLHPYLAEHITGQDGERVLKDMHSHAALIRHSVAGFLKRYLDKPVDASSSAQFEREIEAVSDEFSQEMEREEAIFYTLYLPPEAY